MTRFLAVVRLNVKNQRLARAVTAIDQVEYNTKLGMNPSLFTCKQITHRISALVQK